jgi:hypothetical protein
MEPVTSGFAALQESVWSKEEEDIENIHDKPDKLREYADRVIKALLEPLPEIERRRIAKETIKRYDWAVIAKKWDEAIK